MLREADPAGNTWSYTYDRRGLMRSATSPSGGVTLFAYDDAGNLIERTDPNGHAQRWAYNVLGRRVTERDPREHLTWFVWSLRGDLTRVRDRAGETVYRYDAERRLTEIEGPGGRVTKLVWAGFGKLIERQDPLFGTAKLRYNREGELVEVHNEIGEVHTITRDARGLPIAEHTLDGRSLAYRYDQTGRLTRVRDGASTVDLTYDAADQLVTRTSGDGATERFRYDGCGELIEAAGPHGTITWERDAAGYVVREAQVVDSEEHAVTSLLDKDGARVRRKTTLGLDEIIHRDAAGLRATTLLEEGLLTRHERDAMGHESALRLPNGGELRRAWDPRGRLSRRWVVSPTKDEPARMSAHARFMTDAAGEPVETWDRRNGNTRYEHDAAGRITLAEHLEDGSREEFVIDPAGTWSERGQDKKPLRTYGPGGRLLRKGDVAYVWDDAGQLVERRSQQAVWRYHWDGMGRLTGIEAPDGVSHAYRYDPLGRRLEAKAEKRGSLIERTRFVWDGDVLVHAIRSKARSEGDSIVEERTYLFGDEAPFVPWAERDAQGWLFHLNDPAGTPEGMVDGKGHVVAVLDRSVWGSRGGDDPRATSLRFQGQLADRETGLWYNRFRYYDPELGLYLSPDPIGLEGGLRPYGYVPCPFSWIDPFGLAINTPNTGVVYLRSHPSKPDYVGRSKSQERYDARQDEHRRCDPNYTFSELQTGIGPGIAQAEEDWIRAGGGPGVLGNKIHAQSKKNYKGKVTFP